MSESRGRSGGTRHLKQRVKTARGRRASSTRWLERQLNDPYVKAAQQAGYRARSAFKLIEIDEKHKLLKPGMRVVDLGAAPGGWSQIAVAQTGSTAEKPLVVGIDLLEMAPLPGATFIKMDFQDNAAPDALYEALGSLKADLVLSDLAAATTGHRRTDHLRTLGLFELAADFAINTLSPGSSFLAKVFRGGTEGQLLADLKRKFQTVRHIKPPASRAESPELYVLSSGFRGMDQS